MKTVFLIGFVLLFIGLKSQDTIFFKGDTIRVGELEWDIEKDWRSRQSIISENEELYGPEIKIFISYHPNRMTEQIVFGYIDEEKGFIPHGPARYFYDSGHLLGKRYFEEGEMKGPGEDYYKNGNLKMRTWFQKGEPEGEFLSWYDDGTMEEKGIFRDGELSGRYISYYSNGTPRWIEYFENGEKSGTDTSYYENGVIESIIRFKNDREHSEAEYFHRNGLVWTEYVYQNGKLKDISYIKSKEGRPLLIGSFKDGNGWVNIYDENGLVKEKDRYKNGVFIKTKAAK